MPEQTFRIWLPHDLTVEDLFQTEGRGVDVSFCRRCGLAGESSLFKRGQDGKVRCPHCQSDSVGIGAENLCDWEGGWRRCGACRYRQHMDDMTPLRGDLLLCVRCGEVA